MGLKNNQSRGATFLQLRHNILLENTATHVVQGPTVFEQFLNVMVIFNYDEKDRGLQWKRKNGPVWKGRGYEEQFLSQGSQLPCTTAANRFQSLPAPRGSGDACL